MTSAGTMRNAAALVGVTHQQIGRWLREGEDGGVKSVPSWAAPAIDQAFALHVSVAREQARHDAVPFLRDSPVFMERKLLSKLDSLGRSKYGDRVFSGNTKFIRERLRRKWVENVVRTERFYKVNVRSRIDLRRYTTRIVDDTPEYRRIKTKRSPLMQGRHREDVNKSIRDFVEKNERDDFGNRYRIIDKTEPFPIYTRSLPTVPGFKAKDIADELEQLLNEKHAPAAVGPRTAFAAEYLLQLFPADYEKQLIRQGIIPATKHRTPTAPQGKTRGKAKPRRSRGKR